LHGEGGTHELEALMTARLSLAAALAIVVVVSSGTRSDIGAATPRSQTTQAAPQPQQPSMQDMMKMHEQMLAEMKAGEAKLDALVKEMNAATGDAKVNAVAAVVNELVREHRAMHGRMGQMHQHMMGMGGRMMRP
jgi:hypothetical protein